MSPAVKFLIGLAAAIGATWLHHGPLGGGEALIGALEARARAVVAETELPGIGVQLGRDPLSRVATLSGEADAFQREGQGELKGLNDLVGEIEGIAGVRWADEPEQGGLPLLLESILLSSLAYLAGLAIAWFLWGRRKREGFY